MSRATTTVLITGPVRLYRDSVAAVIAGEPDLEVVAVTATTGETCERARRLRPDVIVADAGSAECIAGLNTLRLAARDAKLVVVALAEREPDVIACAEAGVVGYVGGDGTMRDVVRAIHACGRDATHCSPRVAGALARRIASMAVEPPTATGVAALTTREAEIVSLIDEGLSNKQIAAELAIEVPTVKNHVHNILGKLRVNGRGEAAARLRGGLPGPPRTAA